MNTVTKVATLFDTELNSSLADELIGRGSDGSYSLYGKFLIMVLPHAFKVVDLRSNCFCEMRYRRGNRINSLTCGLSDTINLAQ